MSDFKVTSRNGFYFIEHTGGATFFKENGEWFANTSAIISDSRKIKLPNDCLNVTILNNAERKEKLRKLLS